MMNNSMKVTVANYVQLSLVTFVDVSTSNIHAYESLRKECFTKKTSTFNYFNFPIVCMSLLGDDSGTV